MKTRWIAIIVFIVLSSGIGAARDPGEAYELDVREVEGVPVLWEAGMPYFSRFDQTSHQLLDLSGTWKFQHPENDEIIATSLALLFLSKGRRPVVMAKYKYTTDNEWDLHSRGVHNLVMSVEKRWDQRLSWQTIEGAVATVPDLLETPVLFISGRDGINLDRDQRDALRDYINQGGFIFAEACNGEGCKGAAFDRQFRALVAELFPESQLRPLPG